MRTLEKRYYRPELNVVRFVAFCLVFFNHILPNNSDANAAIALKGFAPQFYAFVDACGFGLSLFFALSAFLICELLLREREQTGKVQIGQFYVRRILRIWPLYYLGLLLGYVAVYLPGAEPQSGARLSWFLVFMGAWQIALHGWLENPMAPLWSISVEEQFYLFVPWIIKFVSRRMLYIVCSVLLLVANGWLYYFGSSRASDSRIWADSFVQFECFAAGVFLCLVLHGRLPQFRNWQRLLLLALGGYGWLFACADLHIHFGTPADNPGSGSLMAGYALAALGSVLVLLAFLGIESRLLPGWAVYLGRISYGLYVYHLLAIKVVYAVFPSLNLPHPALFLLKLLSAFALTLLLAAVSYRYFETPFLRMKRRHAVIETQPV